MSSPIVIGSIKTPGVLGLSTEDPARAEDLSIAYELTNAAFDSNGRMCARKGWVSLTTTGDHGQYIESIHEYVVDDSNKYIIHAAGLKLYRGTVTLVDITGELTPSANDWIFVNFNGKVLGFQAGESPIRATGTGDFVDITVTGGTAPTGGIAISAWGRVWATDTNNQKVKWCGLLDEADWATGGAGEIDLLEVWPDGVDYVVGLAELQNKLVIFGQRSTLIYDGAAVDPSTDLVLVDTVRVGCIAHRSIALVANDLVFLAVDGLHSLQRAIEFSNLPQEPLALGVRTDLVEDILGALSDITYVHAAYDRHEGFYAAQIGAGNYWFFDLRQGVARPSKWIGIGFNSLTEGTDGTLYFGQIGTVGEYTGYSDDGASYSFRYKSAWLDLAQGRELYPKTSRVILVSNGPYVLSFTTGYDYMLDESVSQFAMKAARTVSEWSAVNVATTAANEWGTAEWSGSSSSIVSAPFDLSGAGSRVQVGLRVTIDGYSLCIQRIDITSRLGRIAA